ncbi:hypothetical protein GCM10029963_30440 [Micromonospora andamanensis]
MRTGQYGIRAARAAWRSATSARLLLAQLLDLGLLAAQLTQVVELGATDVTPDHDLDPVDRRAVDRVGPLDADAEAELADGEGLAQPSTLAADDDALEDLDPGPGSSTTRACTFTVSPARKSGRSVRFDWASRASRMFIAASS